MGAKYLMRTSEPRQYPLDQLDYTDYRFNSTFTLLKLLVMKRGKILFVTKWWN